MQISRCRLTPLRAQPNGSVHGLLIVALAIVGFASAFLLARFNSNPVEPTSASGQQSAETRSPSLAAEFPVQINQPLLAPTVDTGFRDIHGHAVTVTCSTCHATRDPNFENKTVADLNEFHQHMNLLHGDISCLSCHNSEDYDALKLADGSRIEYSDVMVLCAQCHGQQTRDFEHGAHGGMTGHWDLSKGPRSKNNCVDCHHPHAPQFPKMQPTFKPKDRFLTPNH